VQAIPRRGPDDTAQVHVVVEVAGRDLKFAEAQGRHQERLEFALRTIDFLARSDHNEKTAVTLNLSPLQLEDLRATGVRWLSTLAVKPGHYSLRVAGHGIETGQTGAVFLDVDVPKFEDERLWIGGLAVSSPAALAIQAGTLPDDLGLSAPPTTTRSFPVGTEITVSADMTTPQSFSDATLRMTVRPQDAPEDSAPVLDRTTTLVDRQTADRTHAWTIGTDVLGPGRFVLHLTLREASGRSAETTMLFDVRDTADVPPSRD
jgi:hypothetical protein